MRARKTVGIKDLKNNLSAYLRQVRDGARLQVTDRQVVVAELRQPVRDPERALEDGLRDLARAGKVRLPRRTKRPLPISPVRLRRGAARAILDELRKDSGE